MMHVAQLCNRSKSCQSSAQSKQAWKGACCILAGVSLAVILLIGEKGKHPGQGCMGICFVWKTPCFSFCFPVLVLMKPLLPMECWWYVSFSQEIFSKHFLNIKGKGGWGLQKPLDQFFLFCPSFLYICFKNGVFYCPICWWYPIISHLSKLCIIVTGGCSMTPSKAFPFY